MLQMCAADNGELTLELEHPAAQKLDIYSFDPKHCTVIAELLVFN